MEICISFSNTNISAYCNILHSCTLNVVDRDSSVGIVTRYELNDPGIESLWRRIFRARLDWPWGPPKLLYDGYRVSFPGVERPGRGVDHLLIYSARLKKL